jgi:uncharacterized membrane protein
MFDSSNSTYAGCLAGIVTFWLVGNSFLLHSAAAFLFTMGVILTVRQEGWREVGMDRLLPMGRVFFSVPLAVFGMQHFTSLRVVVNGVPPWMPGHLFWVCLVGIALIAASLSIISGKSAQLAALLVSIMLFLFVLMIYVPNAVRNPGDRFAIALVFRDLSLSGGALALVGTLATEGRGHFMRWLAVLARCFFAIPMIFFGVEHFLHPDFAPGVPLPKMMPSWIPGHMVWAYITGTALVVCGVSILLNKYARWGATGVGITFLVLVIFIYMPIEIVHPSIEISGELDYVADTLAMGGAALLVAELLARKTVRAAFPS